MDEGRRKAIESHKTPTRSERETKQDDYRYFEDIEFRIESEERNGMEEKKIIGHAAIFDKPADLGWFREIVSPGAFKKSIRNGDIRALFNHDPNYVLGRTTNKTLRLKEDEEGLFMEIRPPETQWAQDLMISIERQDITGASFGFRVMKQDWIDEKKKPLTRYLREVELFDVSPVTFPAYEETDVNLRAKEVYMEYRDSKKKEEEGHIFALEEIEEKKDDKPSESALEWKRKLRILKKRLEIMEREV